MSFEPAKSQKSLNCSCMCINSHLMKDCYLTVIIKFITGQNESLGVPPCCVRKKNLFYWSFQRVRLGSWSKPRGHFFFFEFAGMQTGASIEIENFCLYFMESQDPSWIRSCHSGLRFLTLRMEEMLCLIPGTRRPAEKVAPL